MRSVYDLNNKKNHLKCSMFLDDENDGVTIARYENVRYPRIEKLTDKQISFFWRPEEIFLDRDRKDFMELSDGGQHIFTSNLKRQILLDSVQGRSPALAFLPIASVPELEPWIDAWTFSESIHSRSYSHIIRNIYPDPSKVFDEINDIEEIVLCAKDISKDYDDLIKYNAQVLLHGYGSSLTKYEHKRHVWKALNSVNTLEGIRFYVSFACSWAFAENKTMEGNAKIIKFICRDENVHLGFTQYALLQLPKDDAQFALIQKECKKQIETMFIEAAEQEKQWAKYLFTKGSVIGLTEDLLKQYVEWIACKRMQSINLQCPYKVQQSNPLPWTQNWITGRDRQEAPQEVEKSQYTIGDIDKTTVNNEFLNSLRF